MGFRLEGDHFLESIITLFERGRLRKRFGKAYAIVDLLQELMLQSLSLFDS